MSILPARWRSQLIAVACLGLSLGGCGGLLPKPPERQIYRLMPSFAFSPGLPHVTAQLAVAAPSALAALDTARIATVRSPATLDYFADAEWADHAPFVVQAALLEGFEKSGATAAVGPESLGLHADFVLETALRDFAAIYDSPTAAPHAVVSLNLKLVRLPEHVIVGQTTVRADAAAAANTLADVVAAFDAALGRAVQDAVTWTVGNPALSGHHRSVVSWSRFVQEGGS